MIYNDVYFSQIDQTMRGAAEVSGRHMTEEGWVNNVIADERVVYVRDDRTGRFFSAGFAPVFNPYRSYRCGSGLNYQIVENVTDGLRVTWRIYIPLGTDPLEVWDLRVENLTRRPRRGDTCNVRSNLSASRLVSYRKETVTLYGRCAMNKNSTQIPQHLPDKLAICFYVWNWIFEDAYADLDKAMRETRERGFNCVRLDTGALLTHDQAGKPRGPIRFRPWIEDWNNVPYPIKAHNVDVLERVLELFRMADKHDMVVICTSWLYQDLVTNLEDAALRAEIIAIPCKDRIMELARQHDRLVRLLKERGLAHRIAFVEVLNEAEFSPLFVPKVEPTAPPTFEEFARWTWPNLADKAASAQEFNRAVRFLRERHPDILFTMDYAWSGSLDDLWAPDSQLVDFHYYHGLLNKLYKLLDFPMDREPELDAMPEFRRFLVPNPSSWLEFRAKVQHLRHVGSFWHTASWLYHNIDMDAFEAWYKQEAQANEAHYVETAETWMGKARDFARERCLPLVLDEGVAFWPPANTRLYGDPIAQRHEEIVSDIAIRDGYWGIMPTGYVAPYFQNWNDPAVIAWLQRVNARILGKGRNLE